MYADGMNPESQPSADAASQFPDEVENAPPHYVSFILRCRTTAHGEILARLSEVRTGLCCSLTDLDELPDLVRRRMADQEVA